MTQSSNKAIDQLLRGISTGHVETVRDAWRELMRGEANSVEQVLEKLSSSAWSDNPRGPLAKYFGVLLAALDELDKSAFENEVARLRKSKLHPFHAKTLGILSRRLSDKPATQVGNAVPVFVASDVANPLFVCRNIERWSETKELSLENVTRIDVIGRHPSLEYLGLYNLFFSGIVLTSPTEPLSGLSLWFERLNAEFTFYHEVGHHVLGHSEGGKVDEQEREADEFARSMMRSSRPVLSTTARAFIFPFRPLLKRLHS